MGFVGAAFYSCLLGILKVLLQSMCILVLLLWLFGKKPKSFPLLFPHPTGEKNGRQYWASFKTER